MPSILCFPPQASWLGGKFKQVGERSVGPWSFIIDRVMNEETSILHTFFWKARLDSAEVFFMLRPPHAAEWRTMAQLQGPTPT